MSTQVVPNVHFQACADDLCSGCYPVPSPERPRGTTLPTGESPDRRRTRERNEILDAGRNPATMKPLVIGTSETCGCCDHCILTHGGARSYWKCDLVPITNGAGTDIRKSWPACTAYERPTA